MIGVEVVAIAEFGGFQVHNHDRSLVKGRNRGNHQPVSVYKSNRRITRIIIGIVKLPNRINGGKTCKYNNWKENNNEKPFHFDEPFNDIVDFKESKVSCESYEFYHRNWLFAMKYLSVAL